MWVPVSVVNIFTFNGCRSVLLNSKTARLVAATPTGALLRLGVVLFVFLFVISAHNLRCICDDTSCRHVVHNKSGVTHVVLDVRICISIAHTPPVGWT